MLRFLNRISKCRKVSTDLILLKAVSKLCQYCEVQIISEIHEFYWDTILAYRTDKLYLRNWVTYIVFRVECKRYSRRISIGLFQVMCSRVFSTLSLGVRYPAHRLRLRSVRRRVGQSSTFPTFETGQLSAEYR